MNHARPMALPEVHLSPGGLLVTREPQIVITVLGSCVAVTMLNRESGLAAICHAMLARPQPGESYTTTDPRRFRYVSHALPSMLAAYRRLGHDLRNVEVKFFGGGNVIGRASPGSAQGIGSANIEAACEFFALHSLVVTARNTGGLRGRKILFNTATGEVLLKHLHLDPP